ncbi:MAG: SDR family NAD(P)-dependent oxidoreductase [Candidatus Aegiribacteria sp.]|nr:SDR family NAD(P)-dependent oxidoreductase [Candidatus Aegiribacteria sp.]
MASRALLVGNSDGIGLATTRRLLEEGWNIAGVSRSPSHIAAGNYRHVTADVGDDGYMELMTRLVSRDLPDLCIYFVGIGEPLDLSNMSQEPDIIDINLTGMVRTAAAVIPRMVERGRGHFIGVSSVADELLSAEAPSYHASKAGFSNYLGGLSLALGPKGIHVTNVRFGFVDTKMARGDKKPFMMSADRAAEHILACIRRKPSVFTAPRIVIPLVKFRRLMMRLGCE